jgi:hypothetical protein
MADQAVALTKARDRATELEGKLTTAESTLTLAKEELAKAQEAVRQGTAAAEQLDLAKARAKAAAEELDRVRKRLSAEEQARRAAELAVAAAEAQRRAAMRRLLSAYLAAGAPDKEGLAAVKQAAGRSRLLSRLAAVRKQARGDAAKTAMEQAEAVLTQLAMLDTSDYSAVDRFQRAVRATGLPAKVDAALAAGTEPLAVTNWLSEFRLVLMGVGHAA